MTMTLTTNERVLDQLRLAMAELRHCYNLKVPPREQTKKRLEWIEHLLEKENKQ